MLPHSWHPSLSPKAQRTLSERLAALCAAHPTLLPTTWERVTEVLAPLPDPAPVLDTLLALKPQATSPLTDAVMLDALALAVIGPYPRGALARGILARHISPQPEQYATWLKATLEDLSQQDQTTWFASLRRLKQQESLSLFAHECQGTPVRHTTAHLSVLARGLLDGALRYSARALGSGHLVEKVGIVGMGKLGGSELNYGSDVDLVFVCTQDVFDDPETRRQLEAVLKHLIETFTEVTAHGYIFRVDLRLRPQGTQGLLVQSVQSVAKYLLQWGKTWERSAWFKASWAGGSMEVVGQLLEQIHPFLYRRSLDFTVLDELKQMKQQVQAKAAQPASLPAPHEPVALTRSLFRSHHQRRPPKPARRILGAQRPELAPTAPSTPPPVDEPMARVLGWDAKLGEGGIREVEFFVQALLMVHSGRQGALRVRGTLDALDALLYTGLITHTDHTTLGEAYVFFRHVEHQVQMHEDRQTHTLPLDLKGLEHLSTRMLGQPAQVLAARTLAHRDGVHAIFSKLFEDSAKTTDAPTVPDASRTGGLWSLLAHQEDTPSSQALSVQARAAGFTDITQVVRQLQLLAHAHTGPFGTFGSPRSRQLGQALLESCAHAPMPDRALAFVGRLIAQVGPSKEWFWHMLAQRPHAVRLLVFVFGSSELLATMLLRDVNVIRQLFSIGSSPIRRDPAGFETLIQQRLDHVLDPEHRRGVIQKVHREEVLRLAIHEMGGSLPIASVVGQLSALAQTIVIAMAKEVVADWAPALELCELPFAVVALGKFGGEEIDFGSDLDLVFVIDEDPIWQTHDPHAFARRLVRAISTASDGTGLYAVDTRLRPSGRQGTLVVTWESWQDYYAQAAAPWELQALLRARVLPMGQRALRQAFDSWRTQTLKAASKSARICWPEEIRQMRQRLLPAPAEQASGFWVKASPGGLLDLEFLVQCRQLMGQGRVPFLAHTAHALEANEELRDLVPDYWFLRRVIARLRLTQPGDDAVITDASVAPLSRTMGYIGEARAQAFAQDLEGVKSRVWGAFKQEVGP